MLMYSNVLVDTSETKGSITSAQEVHDARYWSAHEGSPEPIYYIDIAKMTDT